MISYYQILIGCGNVIVKVNRCLVMCVLIVTMAQDISAIGGDDTTITYRDTIVSSHGELTLLITGRDVGLGIADSWTASISGSKSRSSVTLLLSDVELYASSVARSKHGISFIYASRDNRQKVVFALVTADTAIESAVDYEYDMLLDIVRIDDGVYLLVSRESRSTSKLLVDTMHVRLEDRKVDTSWIVKNKCAVDSVILNGVKIGVHQKWIERLAIIPWTDDMMYSGVREKTTYSYQTAAQMSAINNSVSQVDVSWSDGAVEGSTRYGLDHIRARVFDSNCVDSGLILIRAFSIVGKETVVVIAEVIPEDRNIYASCQQLLVIRRPNVVVTRKMLPRIRIVGVHKAVAEIYAMLLSS